MIRLCCCIFRQYSGGWHYVKCRGIVKPVVSTLEKYKPAVPQGVLLFLAGFVWLGVGAMLLSLAGAWLSVVPHAGYYASAGGVLGLVAHRFAFSRIADRNLARLLPMDGKRCLFSFMPWKSYLTITVMITLGALLRHSTISREYLAVLYAGIGLALVLSGLRYMRAFFTFVF